MKLVCNSVTGKRFLVPEIVRLDLSTENLADNFYLL